MEEQVILVDENDNPIGKAEKMKAHEDGVLHRAFSVFIFNSENKLMMQRRASHKYHSGGLWTNTCCSHPRPGEKTADAAKRRLKEEMGFTCDVEHLFSFVYKADLDNELIEHEFDHVFIGNFNGIPEINIEEADDYHFDSLSNIEQNIKKNPEIYTEWFKICLPKVKQLIENKNG